ncbi:hypothetical protein ACFQAT_18035 [Undibacterium arcticum]|uniref:hypothetical protein n=1 Tax=Undibacterium arcticum TaxID=1762892 RepID=UPI00361FCA47
MGVHVAHSFVFGGALALNEAAGTSARLMATAIDITVTRQMIFMLFPTRSVGLPSATFYQAPIDFDCWLVALRGHWPGVARRPLTFLCFAKEK